MSFSTTYLYHGVYAALLVLTAAGPLFVDLKFKTGFSHLRRPLATAIPLTAVPFIIWDSIFTKRGIWGFSPDYTLGITVLSLPIEEIAFFLIVPFATTFIYHLLRSHRNLKPVLQQPRTTPGKALSITACCVLVLCGINSYPRAYTTISTTLAGVLIVLTSKAPWFPLFARMYLIHLLPFTIINGVLTALPVVWYNDAHIIGIRFGTIPIEDFTYSLNLLVPTIALLERWRIWPPPSSADISSSASRAAQVSQTG